MIKTRAWPAPLNTDALGGDGFATTILVALVVVGVLILLARWTASKPRSRRRTR